MIKLKFYQTLAWIQECREDVWWYTIFVKLWKEYFGTCKMKMLFCKVSDYCTTKKLTSKELNIKNWVSLDFILAMMIGL